ncbi:MAG: cytochrome c oxidase assembly protein [Gammaproteobacteria bacterium]|nr:MAG: cytochrome c oxidase assembly protein [Gammaproteobacteria bacterium]
MKGQRRLVLGLFLAVAGMFGFGFALVPLYNALCDITGLNGKTGRVSEAQAAAQGVDETRLITVEFVTSVNSDLPWRFKALQKKVKVHPGEIREVRFYAENLSGHTITGQAIPSISPGNAARYFNKTECFCFTQQTLRGKEAKEMPVRFIIDRHLPKDIHTVTLSYTFFDIQS